MMYINHGFMIIIPLNVNTGFLQLNCIVLSNLEDTPTTPYNHIFIKQVPHNLLVTINWIVNYTEMRQDLESERCKW